MFWRWLKENHPIIYEVVWWIIILLAVFALLNDMLFQIKF